jgi:hypothetical protein
VIKKPDGYGTIVMSASLPGGVQAVACTNGDVRFTSSIEGTLGTNYGAISDKDSSGVRYADEGIGLETSRFIAKGGVISRTLKVCSYKKIHACSMYVVCM